MRHLSPERLAAVADEHPTPDEAAHLAQCGRCVDGRDAHRRLIAGAALERDRPTQPLSDWGAISARLRSEGLIRSPELTKASAATAAESAPVLPFARTVDPTPETATSITATPVLPMRRRVVPAWAMRAAAALALVAGGALVGRMSVVSTEPQQVAQVGDKKPLQPEPPPSGMIQPVANSQVVLSPDYITSTAQAQRLMLQAEATYVAAMQYLAANDSTLRPPVADPVEAYRTRLAKLDEAVSETRRALKLSPTNPALNDYYLTSVSARETTLRQIDDALPVNERVTRF